MRKFKRRKPTGDPKPKPNPSKSLSETAIIKGDLAPKPKANPFVNYATYIKSDKWADMKKLIFEWRGKRCQLCWRDDKPVHVHHMTYKRIGNEDPRDLLVVCETCHKFIHKEHEHWK